MGRKSGSKIAAGGFFGFLEKVFRGLLLALPAALFCSYFPVIRLGASESMNFELSLTLIWLILFDLVVICLILKKKLWRGVFTNWKWLLFPAFLSLSVLWSLNFVRGFLTVGVLWAIYLAGYGILSLRKELCAPGFWQKFLKVFFGTSVGAVLVLILQCVLDIFGVPREVTQMCPGCVYAMFGFSHPNGFAIEPQFMGNLLLAPAILAGYLIMRGQKKIGLFLILGFGVFLTFSRGAIYAFVLAIVLMIVVFGIRRKIWKRGLMVFGLMMGAFVLTLNFQGVMAAVSKTNDTYVSGVGKVLNQLSLGIIDIRGGEKKESLDKPDEEREGEAVFDGYVAESTDTRMRLTKAGIEIWRKDLKTMAIGVGLGGAGQALYDNELSPAPKEIVQNEYVSLLLETGVVGISLFVYTIYLIVRSFWKSSWRMALFTLVFAYAITLFFFSGLPNALHIYIIPIVFCRGDIDN